MGSLDGNCEVRTAVPVTTEFPHLIATTCDQPAAAEVDITLPGCQTQYSPGLTFRVRLCASHIAAYTGWH